MQSPVRVPNGGGNDSVGEIDEEGPAPFLSDEKRRRSSVIPLLPNQIVELEANLPENNNTVPTSDAIKVVCRFRPVRKLQRRESSSRFDVDDGATFNLDESNNSVEYSSHFTEPKQFTFDKVLGENTTQLQVFDQIKPVVDSVMSGFNGCVMAYGQTSSGKSHTMEGVSIWDEESGGIIPRCIASLFEEIGKAPSTIQFQLIVSYFEVYCEKIRDLLNPVSINLKIRETKDNGFVVQDVTEIYCNDKESVLKVIDFGKTNRASAATLMNAESSRSHSIVSILLDQKNTTTGRQRRGNLFLVDLAGSEKVSKSGASGMRLEEAKNINSSLTTLGMVINSLCDNASHIPYRDSKLTMILMEALGGNSKTTLIICCTREPNQQAETLSTLRFGERAKKIKNHAKINEELSVKELQALLAAAQQEVLMLRGQVNALRKNQQHNNANNNNNEVVPNGKRKVLLEEGMMIIKREEYLEKDQYSKALAGIIEEKETLIRLLQAEIANLQAKIVYLEEEMEEEKARTRVEHEAHMMYLAENNALRTTISELEEKLVKSLLEIKQQRKLSTASMRSPSVDYGEIQTNTGSNLNSVFSSPTAGASVGGTRKESGKEQSEAAVEEEMAMMMNGAMLDDQGEKMNVNEGRRPSTSSIRMNSLDGGDDVVVHGHGTYEVNTSNTARTSTGGGLGLSDTGTGTENNQHEVSIKQLEEHSIILHAQLENEILSLSHTVSQHATETRTALESAQKYADKYMKLREDYELHIQRLMLKLTQEQQARTILEDQLENATRKVIMYSREAEQGKKGILNWFVKKADATINSMSRTPTRGSNAERELNMTRALELANLRVAQLTAEMEHLKESHSIVVETKESVISTLSRRINEVSDERDKFKNRTEDLTETVDKLTSLLRNQQLHGRGSMMSRSSEGGNNGLNSSAGPLHTLRMANYIRGGSRNVSRTTTLQDVLNSQSNHNINTSNNNNNQVSSDGDEVIREDTLHVVKNDGWDSDVKDSDDDV